MERADTRCSPLETTTGSGEIPPSPARGTNPLVPRRPLAERAAMSSAATPSVEISIALLSWINDQLRDSVAKTETQQLRRRVEWLQNTVTALAAGLSCL